MNCRAAEMLKRIALMGGHSGSTIMTSSSQMARYLGISQQTASSLILKLLNDGLITRSFSGRRQVIGLTEKGLRLLQAEYLDYRRIFEKQGELALEGRVVSGLGEGRYYLSQTEYIVQIEKLLGFRPFPGTLNIRLSPGSPALPEQSGRIINGFESNGRAFGDVIVFPARIKNTECALIIPRRTHHRDAVEIIAAENLRNALGLNDGDAVKIKVFLD